MHHNARQSDNNMLFIIWHQQQLHFALFLQARTRKWSRLLSCLLYGTNNKLLQFALFLQACIRAVSITGE